MAAELLRTAVAVFIYNRPAHVRRVLAAIAQAAPAKLLVVAEGPREGDAEDAAACEAARAEVWRVDWPGEVEWDVADTDIGLSNRIETGIDWVFEQAPEAILLEDDCVPDPTFFPFAAELLERYRDDPRVMMIGGLTMPDGMPPMPYSYDFYRLGMTWGWATWRRAWALHDPALPQFDEIVEQGVLERVFETPELARHWAEIFSVNAEWDARWLFTCVTQGGLTVVPRGNLISNIGFGPAATHSTDAASPYNSMPTAPMAFPLRHPPFVLPHPAIDGPLARRWYREPTLRAHLHDFAVHRSRRLRGMLGGGR